MHKRPHKDSFFFDIGGILLSNGGHESRSWHPNNLNSIRGGETPCIISFSTFTKLGVLRSIEI